MDHLDVPAGCKPQMREIPYLGIAPKYDKLGFDGFLERHDRHPDELIAPHSILKWRADYIESFVQEWFFFGLLDEFARACEISINLEDFITDSLSDDGKIITTASLYDVYARRIAIRQLDINAVLLGLEPGDLVRLPHDQSADIMQQIMDFCQQKLHQGLPSHQTIMSRASEHLSMINVAHGEDTIYKDESGILVPIRGLHQRISATRAIITVINNGLFLDDLLAAKRIGMAKYLSRAQTFLRVLMSQSDPAVRFDVVLSIDILCHTLVKIIDVTFGVWIELRSPNFSLQFEEIMIARNWCPSRASQLANAANTPTGYLASLLPSHETSLHDECSRRRCLKLPFTLQTMPRLHREHCDRKCPLAVILEAKLIEVWVAGGIPGLRFKTNEHLEIVDCAEEPFIAISHVWSHGLGNEKLNELPSCQVHFLFETIKPLSEKAVVMWIDTLCVPVHDQGAKRLAISRLRRVYSEASKVLVIDKHLMHVGSDPREQVMQLLGSEWQRRLWTLQEGRLAREVHIQFKEGAIALSELMEEIPVLQSTSSNADIFDFFIDMKLTMGRRFSSLQDPQLRFTALVEDLALRSVTIRTDEPICLATLLDLSIEDYDPYPTMLDIYRSLPSIPAELMFLKQPRLEDRGFGWAPSTFLEEEFLSFIDQLPTPIPGRLCAHGLILTKDCLLLDTIFDFHRIPTDPPKVWIISSGQQKYGIAPHHVASPDGQLFHIERSLPMRNPAVIWEIPYSHFGINGCFTNTSKAVLVSRDFDEEGTTYCTFEMSLYGWHIREEYQDYHEQRVRTPGSVVGHYAGEMGFDKCFCVG